jgi:FAD/FMN-containing dehydrogenase
MAYEFFTDKCSRAARGGTARSRPPFETPSTHYVLLEVERRSRARSMGGWRSLFERGLVTDGTLAADSDQAKFLWALREGISESLSATGLPHKNDIALPIARG